MFWLFPLAHALSEGLSRDNRYKAVSFVVSEANTVHYIQTKMDQEVYPDIPKKEGPLPGTNITVYRNSPYSESNLFCQYAKSRKENTFFFTTSTKGKYYVVVSPDKLNVPVRVDYKIYSGEANRPSIVSANDVEVGRAELRIRKLLEYVKNNISIQEMGYEDDTLYTEIYSGITRRAMMVIGMKIAATVFTLLYSGYKTKQFYTTRAISRDEKQ